MKEIDNIIQKTIFISDEKSNKKKLSKNYN